MNTERSFAWTAVFVLLVIPHASRAEESKKIRPFVTLDLFLPGNAGDGLWQDAQTGMRQLSGAGYSSVGSIESKAAIGGRIGIMAPVSEAFDIGFSGGYIAGPNSDVSITATGGGRTGVLTDKRELSFARFLVEPTFNVKMSDTSAFHMAAGLGVAHGTTRETATCAGTACTVNGTIANYSSTWDGFTWEFSPYFSFSKGLAGLRYAGFPKFSGSATNSKVEWTTLGFFGGITF